MEKSIAKKPLLLSEVVDGVIEQATVQGLRINRVNEFYHVIYLLKKKN